MLDVAAQQPDNPAPETAPSSGDQTTPAPRKAASPPTDDGSAQPQDDSGQISASCKRPAGDTSKAGEATAEEKNSGKGLKQTLKDEVAKDAAQAVVAPDPAQSVPQTGTVAAALIAPDAPKPDGVGNVVASGDCAKAADEIAAAAGAMTPAGSVAPEAPKRVTGTALPANGGAAQAAAAIDAAAKGAGTPSPIDLPTVTDNAPEEWRMPCRRRRRPREL